MKLKFYEEFFCFEIFSGKFIILNVWDLIGVFIVFFIVRLYYFYKLV